MYYPKQLNVCYQVINYANNQQRAKDLIEELHKIPSIEPVDGARFEAIQADVGDRPSVQRMVEDTIKKFGRLDVVVSNTGWTRLTNFMNLDEAMVDEDWDKCLLYNVSKLIGKPIPVFGSSADFFAHLFRLKRIFGCSMQQSLNSSRTTEPLSPRLL